MPRPPIDDLRTAAALALDAGDFILGEYKAARDKREPGRRQKIGTQAALTLILSRVFRKQRKAILDQAQFLKAATPIVPGFDYDFDWDDEDEAELIAELLRAVKNGVMITRGADLIDSTLTNKEAAAWAKRYAGQLVKNINRTTIDVIREAVRMFVETPGFTIGNLTEMLPFGEQRALTIAVTETTRSYAQGNKIIGDQLKEQFPDTQVIDIWFTNNDDIVCELCGPLDGKEIEHGATFYEPDEYSDGQPPRHVNCRCWTETSTKVT